MHPLLLEAGLDLEEDEPVRQQRRKQQQNGAEPLDVLHRGVVVVAAVAQFGVVQPRGGRHWRQGGTAAEDRRAAEDILM